jgi:hypothetical protein
VLQNIVVIFAAPPLGLLLTFLSFAVLNPSLAISNTTRTMSSGVSHKVLNLDNINPHVRAAKYAVRGELAVKSEQYRAKLAKGEGKDLPFDTVIAANIGNPQQLDQKPITFFRQVASLLENPGLLEHENVLIDSLGYKSDVIARAKKLLKEVKSVGAYSQSQGAPGIRQSVAEYIERMDSQRVTDFHLTDCNQDEMATQQPSRTSTSATAPHPV